MVWEEVSVIASAVSTVLIIVQAYLVYRIERAKLSLESYVGITEKSELEIEPQVQGGGNEIIRVTNTGLVQIDEMKANIDVLVERRKKASLPLHLKWERNTFLSSKEIAVIPLYEKFSDFFQSHKLITLVKGPEFTSEDPETGEEVMDTIYFRQLAEVFSVILSIEIESKIQGQTKTARKKFRFLYSFKPPPFPDYEDDYEISINEHMGEWKEEPSESK